MEDKDDPQEARGREMETHTRFHGCRGALEPREARLEPDGEALPAVRKEPKEIEDAKMQDNACLDVDIGESDIETRKKRRITFKERPTHKDEDDFGGGTRAQSSGELEARGTEEQRQKEVVLRRIRISGKWSQEHQEDQQPKKAKNNDEDMDTGKIEDEEDDGYQPNKKQPPWDMEDEEVFDSRSGEILEQELVQMARKEELDFMEKFGVCEATIDQCFTETGRAPVGTEWVDVNKGIPQRVSPYSPPLRVSPYSLLR